MDFTNGRREFLGGVITVSMGTAVSGCLDEGGEESTDSGEIPEPDELPAGLTEEGVDIPTLEETVLSVVTEDSYQATLLRSDLDDGEQYDNQGERVHADTVDERGLHIQANDESPLEEESLRDAERLQTDYYKENNAFRGPEDPSHWDQEFDFLADRVANRAVDEVFTSLEGTVWESPEWDFEAGVYVIEAVEVGDDFPDAELFEGELHVDSDGVPVRVFGEVEENDSVTQLELTFTVDNGDVSAPDWVDDVEVPADEPDDAVDREAIQPGTEIVLEGFVSAWSGLSPEMLPEEGNPTLVLEAGAEYALRWEQGDGLGHNIEIRDENGTVVRNLETAETANPGQEQRLEFTASEEMAEYVCAPHAHTMAGNIDIR